jgi:hypothetical protein
VRVCVVGFFFFFLGGGKEQMLGSAALSRNQTVLSQLWGLLPESCSVLSVLYVLYPLSSSPLLILCEYWVWPSGFLFFLCVCVVVGGGGVLASLDQPLVTAASLCWCLLRVLCCCCWCGVGVIVTVVTCMLGCDAALLPGVRCTQVLGVPHPCAQQCSPGSRWAISEGLSLKPCLVLVGGTYGVNWAVRVYHVEGNGPILHELAVVEGVQC